MTTTPAHDCRAELYCPFCGAFGQRIEKLDGDDNVIDTKMHCKPCGYNIQLSKWNTRAKPTEPAGDDMGEMPDSRLPGVEAHGAEGVSPPSPAIHDSDCATHNEPAMPNGGCDCSLKASGISDNLPGRDYTQAELDAAVKHLASLPAPALYGTVMTPRDGQPVEKSKYRADFLFGCENDSVEEAGYEFANASTEEYRKEWWSILLQRATMREYVTPEMVRVIATACGVVAADTYKHPVMSREDALKEGVAELHDAVNAYHAAQPAKSDSIEGGK